MDYDVIVFDMDGVLLPGRATPEEIYRRATSALIADFGVSVADGEQRARLERPGDADRFRRACADLALPAEAAWGYREHAATEFENGYIDDGNRPPFEDTAVLEALADQYALGIASNNRHGTVRYCVDHFGWREHIESHRGRFPHLADFDRMKPDPAYLEWILDRIGSGNALFVGDRRSDVETAHRAGCDAALLSREGEPPPGSPSASRAISSLTELVSDPP